MGTVTIKGTVFEVYGTRALADDYMKARLGASAFTSAGGADRDRALVTGTRWIDRQNWAGQATDVPPAQVLQFPRTGLVDKDGNAVGSVAVPLLVEEANYELALILLQDATAQDKTSTASNVKAVGAGSARVQFFRPDPGTKLPAVAQELIGIFLEGGVSGAGNLATGADACSTFEDIDQFGLNRGFP